MSTPEPPIGQSPSDELLVGPLPEASEFLAEAAKLARRIVAAWHEAGDDVAGDLTLEGMAQAAVDICAENMAMVDLPALRERARHG